mmetsp:Transcript_29311/g.76110  ORF Transcript_29311/g.76110 Transcript_29311/m.76110 type:complete len:153 (+) Transcript_29311:702-1160(+)
MGGQMQQQQQMLQTQQQHLQQEGGGAASAQSHLCVTGLPAGLTDERFQEVMAQYTRMKWAKVISTSTATADGQLESVGMVEAETAEDAKWAFDNLNGNLASGLPGHSRPLAMRFVSSQEAASLLGGGGTQSGTGGNSAAAVPAGAAARYAPY